MKLAPIGISTYIRISHLEQTIDSLSKNTLAQESELYIFSDAPKKGDELKVAKVREYIHTINGFKAVNIVERERNNRVNNNRTGYKFLLEKYGKMIWLEEDIVTAPGFLAFMNGALDFYKKSKRVISITGYCPPLKILDKYKKDIFILQRFSAWGFATWKEKFDPFGFELRENGIESFLANKKEIKDFKKNGDDMYRMVQSEYEGKLDALDVKLMYYQYKNNLWTVYPSKSLVQNIGFDGSGIHCGVDDKFLHDTLWNKTENFNFIADIQEDKKIKKANHRFRKIGMKMKLIILSRRVGVFPFLMAVKKILKKS